MPSPSVPFILTSANDNCGEKLGSFSYLFNFVSNVAPLAHMKITRTGLMDMPARMNGQRSTYTMDWRAATSGLQ